MRQYVYSMDQFYSYEPRFWLITITGTNFNYTVVVVVLGFAGMYWLVSARRWFTGPKVQGTAEELAEIEQELESLG